MGMINDRNDLVIDAAYDMLQTLEDCITDIDKIYSLDQAIQRLKQINESAQSFLDLQEEMCDVRQKKS